MEDEHRRDFDEILKRGHVTCAPWSFVSGQVRRVGKRKRAAAVALAPTADEVDEFLSDAEGPYRAEFERRGCHHRGR